MQAKVSPHFQPYSWGLTPGWESALTRQIDFIGKSGTVYRYTALEESRPLPPAGANVLIAKVEPEGLPAVLYVGETDNLAAGAWREPLNQARERHGDILILMRLNVRSAIRLSEQDDMIEQYDPPMNRSAGRREAPPSDGEQDSPPA